LNDENRESKAIFIGRKDELAKLFESIRSKRSITLIIGEEGIGKSAILNEFQARLRRDDPNNYLVGFMMKLKS
jgi:AAA+ ATPase superfamily predicted ATPase